MDLMTFAVMTDYKITAIVIIIFLIKLAQNDDGLLKYVYALGVTLMIIAQVILLGSTLSAWGIY